MAKYKLLLALLMLLLFFAILYSGCKKKEETTNNDLSYTWDVDNKPVPQFVSVNYIELASISRISKYRSGFGHDYSDGSEHCRSLKHYFEPKADVDWSQIKIFCPVKGIVTRLTEEWAGTQIEIQSDDYPAFRFTIFHVKLSVPLNLNDKVSEGQILGTHIGSQTMSDIAVWVNDPSHLGRLVSYFDVVNDAVFNEYIDRGLKNRQELIISKAIRDANPLTCNGETFTSFDVLENWVTLTNL